MFEISELKKQHFSQLTSESGCYVFKDISKGILYIGKAKNLKKRILSYFSNQEKKEAKIKSMLDKARYLEIYKTQNEAEALILETILIKKYKPKYNKLMKDDKNYIWIKFDKSKPFFVPEIVREKLPDNAVYYGPYPKAFPARMVINTLRKIFPFCMSNFSYKQIDENIFVGQNKRPCLDYYIGLCAGACVGKVTSNEHKENMDNIENYFGKNLILIIKQLEDEMKYYSVSQEYEKAKIIKEKIKNFKYILQKINLDKLIKQANQVNLKRQNNRDIVAKLYEIVKIPIGNKKNIKIECYDISNISGKYAVGSMVVAIDGNITKSLYRKFKIKRLNTPNDFAMMKQVLARRLKYINNNSKIKDKSFTIKPDIIIVDGGKGQMSLAYRALYEAKLHKDIILLGLAKREEDLIIVKSTFRDKITEFKLIKSFSFDKDLLFFLQRIRDEAHRFAISYHRKLRAKCSIGSNLSNVPGIGKVLEKRLYEYFEDFEAMRKASLDELSIVLKNKQTAKRLYRYLHKDCLNQ